MSRDQEVSTRQSSIPLFTIHSLHSLTHAAAELLRAPGSSWRRRPDPTQRGPAIFLGDCVWRPQFVARKPLALLSTVLSRHGDRPSLSANHCPQFDAHVSDRTIHKRIDFPPASGRGRTHDSTGRTVALTPYEGRLQHYVTPFLAVLRQLV